MNVKTVKYSACRYDPGTKKHSPGTWIEYGPIWRIWDRIYGWFSTY